MYSHIYIYCIYKYIHTIQSELKKTYNFKEPTNRSHPIDLGSQLYVLKMMLHSYRLSYGVATISRLLKFHRSLLQNIVSFVGLFFVNIDTRIQSNVKCHELLNTSHTPTCASNSHIYIYISVYIHVHTYTHIHIYTYTHTHIYTHTILDEAPCHAQALPQPYVSRPCTYVIYICKCTDINVCSY